MGKGQRVSGAAESPQGTPRSGLCGREVSARLPRGASVRGWAKNSRGMAGQGRPVGGPWGGAGRGRARQPGPRTGRQWRWRSHPVPGGRPAAAQLTGYFFPCLTKYGQRAQPEGPLGQGACLGCLSGYIRTAKVRPAPDPRRGPRLLWPLGSALPSPPLPRLCGSRVRAGPFACVSLHTLGTFPFCSPDLYLVLTPAGVQGCRGVLQTQPRQGGLKVCGCEVALGNSA